MAGETPKMTTKIQLSTLTKPSVYSSQENRSQLLVNNSKDGIKQTQGSISNGNNLNKSETQTVNEEATPGPTSKPATKSNYYLIYFI